MRSKPNEDRSDVTGDDPNLALIRSFYADWAQGDFSRGDFFTDDVEFVTGSPEPRTYRGRGGTWEGWHDFLTAWKDFRVEAHDVVEVGPDLYLVETALHGRGRESGVPIDGEGTNVVAMRDGRIARFEIHWDHSVAVEAARRLVKPRR